MNDRLSRPGRLGFNAIAHLCAALVRQVLESVAADLTIAVDIRHLADPTDGVRRPMRDIAEDLAAWLSDAARLAPVRQRRCRGRRLGPNREPAWQRPARAWFNASLDPQVVCGQHGWWRACPELGLPAYPPFGPDSANLNLVLRQQPSDPMSGSSPLRVSVCNIQPLVKTESSRTPT